MSSDSPEWTPVRARRIINGTTWWVEKQDSRFWSRWAVYERRSDEHEAMLERTGFWTRSAAQRWVERVTR